MGTVTGYALVALLVSICYVSTDCHVIKPIPDEKQASTPSGKVYVYKYSASVTAGQNEPAPFASKLQINAKLIYKSQPEAVYLKFHDVQFNIYNGRDDGTAEGKFHPIEEAIDYFHQPFMVVYNKHHEIEGVKFAENEATWSKNMKRGLASLFHLDRIDNENSTSYHGSEDTIYGKCNVDYWIWENGEKDKILKQVYEPRKCSNFVLFDVTDYKGEGCDLRSEEDLVTAAKKVYTYGSIEDVANYALKKVISHEKFSYLPWSHRNYGVQFIETNQTAEFEEVADESEYNLSVIKFDDVKSSNLAFDKHEYIPNVSSAEEVHLGRYQADSKEKLVPIVKKLLVQMVEFLKENQIDVEEKNPEHKYLLENLYRFLGYMDKESLRYIFDHFNTHSGKGKMTRKIFLRMLPHVGTQAVWDVVLDIINDHQVYSDIDEDIIIHILTNLPMFVLNPTEGFATHVEGYLSLPDHVSYKVKRVGILCYSILLHKVYKSVGHNIPTRLASKLKTFYDRIKYENTYNNKILYMMAMRNVGVGIYSYLAPIVKGEDIFYVDVMIEKREKYRIAAMWAIAKSISYNYSLTNDLFWPILANSSNPLSLRITAYELLVPRNPSLDMRILMNVHDLMATERDQHLFNYHYTTLKSNVESSNPCMQAHAENMRKILRMTKPRNVLSSALSTANVHDYYDTLYGHGKTFKMAAEINEATGVPQTGYYEVISTSSRKSKLTTGYYWNIDGINLNTIIQIAKNLINPSAHIDTEITDEKVQKILRQTQGYKNFDRHIHVEIWTMDKGYVTNVQVFFENGLTDYLRELVTKYKPDADQLMDINDKYDINAVDIYFANHYKMVVASGIGLPAMFYNDAPYMMYTKVKPHLLPQKNLAMRFEFDARFHRNSVYQMKFYNPFADITQSVQRHTVATGALPIDVTFSLQMSTQSLKLELPRLAKQSSAAGLKIQSVDQVVIHKDVFKNYLQTHCPTCQNVTAITNGPMYKNTNLQVTQNLDTGLEFTYGMFDCEQNFEPNAEVQEWYRVFYSPKNNRKDDIFAKLRMVVEQGLFNYVNNPYTGACGLIVKAAPSTEHPVSNVEMNLRASAMISVERKTALTLRGNIDVKSAKTNETMRNWEIDMSTEMLSDKYSLKAKLTRKEPNEKNLKICFEAVKEYPKLEDDVSNIEYKTVSRVALAAGHTSGDDCVTDQLNVKAEIVGELLDEQIEELKNYAKPGSCFKNASNPLDLDITKPFDWNCLYQTVKGTTMRKYTAIVEYKEIPLEYYAKFQMIGDWARSFWGPGITYRSDHTEGGVAKVYMTYPASKSYGNITFVTPYYTWEYIDVIYEQDDIEKRQNDLVFDNIAFPTAFLVDFYKNDIRPCIAHAHELINDMNQTIPMEFKDWTLMSGDHGLMSYAVFVKTIADDKVAVRIYIPDNVLEVTPGESKPSITLNGDALIFNNEARSIENSIFDISTTNKLIAVETKKFSKVKIYYTPYNVIVMPHIILDRNVDGVCGHMGSTVYTQQVPLVYASA